MKSRANSPSPALSLPLRTSEQLKVPFRNAEEASAAFRKPEDDGYGPASALFDEAMKGSGLTNQEVAFLVTVSESLVGKWRACDSRACPSFAQLLRLPVGFHVELYRALNRRLGLSRALLIDALDALGALALLAS